MKLTNFHKSELEQIDELTGPKMECFYKLKGLLPSTAYFVVITAFSERGEGYKPENPFMMATRPLSFEKTTGLYVWGDNTFSQIGLSES